ncbi:MULTISPECIES: DUF3106 domain-containing protein [unclassified Cupriavidus]|uniref:DUF3106 domain-containing protein n=1 Tax=unclassified Cupriavidus TaxID=2640874 RepID=UPI001C004DEB|nr:MULTISPECIES: DUF3106 domain-containing protein [unclassified Cupriavidus]MCA3191403.1 DUF3106 domain-containing protein [Cupriavidus sp.]MCA3196567.1 DUF3106 domain-containing protein [Cupriavidus sp.]MCA3203147.1 DUF3106 domain-containing protein [Cupriavidus sp.]MCA3234355.1 DUF3106 domain-containing protein [Cupriavidus sp.]QWE95165.1 DUF3106 domain-containing protein [Cupriavidus sp. EM10]
MARTTSRTDAFRRRLAALCAAGATLAALFVDVVMDGAHAQGAQAQSASQPAARPILNAHPTWQELSATHRQILAPLQPLWETIPELNRRKWQRIADLYPTLKPEEQQRLQQRMAEWVRMTPQQRRLARENYQITRQLPAEKKAEAWDRYQQLPEEQKKKLAAAEKVPRRPGAVSALPSGKRPPADTGRQIHHQGKPASAPEAAPASAPPAPALAGASAATAPVAPAPAPAAPTAAVPATPAQAPTLSPPVTGEAATDFNQNETRP